MRKGLFSVSLALIVAGCATDYETEQGAPGAAQQTVGGASGTLAAQDATFVQQASQSGLAEVKEGQLAMEKSQTEAVREYGQRLVTDHTKANQQLKQIATSKGAAVASDLGKHQTHYDRLAKLSGPEFDQAFKEQAIKDHEEAIRLFEQQIEQGRDANLKSFAQEHLPHLREHLAMAKQLSVGEASETQPETQNQPQQQE